MSDTSSHRKLATRLVRVGAAAGAAAAAYMAFEAQWVQCLQENLPVPGLPSAWAGTTILHLSDVHAGIFAVNERSLRKAVEWAEPLHPDLVLLTGDVVGDPRMAGRCLDLLSQLNPPLGKFAVTGNHEYGISKNPLASTRDTTELWQQADITLLRDTCHALPPREGVSLLLCGADYLTNGCGLLGMEKVLTAPGVFPVLMSHEPPSPDTPLAQHFALAFAGHTHGGQIRVPKGGSLAPFDDHGEIYLHGVYGWGRGLLVVSRGIGTSFVPLRLLTRPEATLWRLV